MQSSNLHYTNISYITACDFLQCLIASTLPLLYYPAVTLPSCWRLYRPGG